MEEKEPAVEIDIAEEPSEVEEEEQQELHKMTMDIADEPAEGDREFCTLPAEKGLSHNPTKKSIFARYVFQERKRQVGETFESFFTDICRLVKGCTSHDAEKMVRDRIVCGVISQNARNKLLYVGEQLTMNKAVDIVRTYEATKQCQLATMQQEVEKKQQTENFSADQRPKTSKDNVHPKNRSKTVTSDCNNCGQRHRRETCPAFGTQCSLCKKMNHLSTVCTSRPAMRTVASMPMPVVGVENEIPDQVSPSAVLPASEHSGKPVNYFPADRPTEPQLELVLVDHSYAAKSNYEEEVDSDSPADSPTQPQSSIAWTSTEPQLEFVLVDHSYASRRINEEKVECNLPVRGPTDPQSSTASPSSSGISHYDQEREEVAKQQQKTTKQEKQVGAVVSEARYPRPHKVAHTGNKRCACTFCNKSFVWVKSWRRHIKFNHTGDSQQHTGEGKIVHGCCKKSFMCASRLNQHKFIHSGEKNYMCDVCGKAFFQARYLKSHKLHLHGICEKARVQCEVCGKSFSERNMLNQHRLIHAEEKNHLCDVCGKAFTLASRLKSHKFVHDKREANHICDVCHKCFANTRSLDRHKLIHTGKKRHIHVCENCGKAFTQPGHLKVHELIHAGIKQHVCEVCGKAFRQFGNFQRHMLIHTGEKNHVCQICDKAFTQASTLKEHQLVHTRGKKYACEACNKVFRHACGLRFHKLSVHGAGGKKQGCNVCGKAFLYASSLKAHKLTHTGERKHVCNKAFSYAGSLKTHGLIHGGEKNHVCDVCGKAFTQPVHLKLHKLVVHIGTKPHACDICSEAFSLADSMRQHRQTHVNEKSHLEKERITLCSQ